MKALRINIGCGASPIPGWENFDNSWTVRAANIPLLKLIFRSIGLFRGKESFLEMVNKYEVKWADATKLIPLPDNSCSIVYSSHMVEHLNLADASKFYKEVMRVLAPGGFVRIAVPSIQYHLDFYNKSHDADAFVSGIHMAFEMPKTFFDKLRFLIVGPRHHQWMYDGISMAHHLSNAGFLEAQVVPAGSTTIAGTGELDLAERAPESVFVEARSPKMSVIS